MNNHLGVWGQRRVTGTEYDDGRSRQFNPDSPSPQQIVAEILARREGWAEIRPLHWRTAGALVRELRKTGWLRSAVERRKVTTRRAAEVYR